MKAEQMKVLNAFFKTMTKRKKDFSGGCYVWIGPATGAALRKLKGEAKQHDLPNPPTDAN